MSVLKELVYNIKNEFLTSGILPTQEHNKSAYNKISQRLNKASDNLLICGSNIVRIVYNDAEYVYTKK